MWNPDTDLLDQTRAFIREALEALAGDLPTDARDEEAAILLEAAGTLVGLGDVDELRQMIVSAEAAQEACRNYLVGLDLSALDEAGAHAASEAPALMLLDPEDALELASSINEALEQRDRVELLRMGAEVLCPGHEFDAEQESAWLAFDEIVAERVWRLLSLGDTRWVPSAWMRPDQRSRFPWRTRGYGLGREALDALTDTAELLAHFPEAWEHLEALIQTFAQAHSAQTSGEASGESSDRDQRAAVIDLSVYRARAARGADGRLAVAAADEDSGANEIELPGLDGVVELGLRGQVLVAYVLAKDGGTPWLEWADGPLDGELIQGTNATYRFVLPDAPELTLAIPGRSEEWRVVLRRATAE